MPYKKAACFTGHRPESFCAQPDDFSLLEPRLKQLLKQEILHAIQQGFTVFYCGMARGIDILAGEVVLSLKTQFPQIELISVIPFLRQPYYWTDSWITRYNYLYDHSKKILISREYSPDCYHRRNRYMVDHSELVIAVTKQDLSHSGTASTIRYARQQHKTVIPIIVTTE